MPSKEQVRMATFLLLLNIERALAWIDHHADCDNDGFCEYVRHSEQGLISQGWKDSWDAVFHADGSLAEAPLALVEVQGYVWGYNRMLWMR